MGKAQRGRAVTRLTRRADPLRGRLTGDGKGPWPSFLCASQCVHFQVIQEQEKHVWLFSLAMVATGLNLGTLLLLRQIQLQQPSSKNCAPRGRTIPDGGFDVHRALVEDTIHGMGVDGIS